MKAVSCVPRRRPQGNHFLKISLDWRKEILDYFASCLHKTKNKQEILDEGKHVGDALTICPVYVSHNIYRCNKCCPLIPVRGITIF